LTWNDVTLQCSRSFEEGGISLCLFRQVCLLRELLEKNGGGPPTDLLIDPFLDDVTLEWGVEGKPVMGRFVVRKDGFENWNLDGAGKWVISRHEPFPPFCYKTVQQ
jgi:hypothetical protein